MPRTRVETSTPTTSRKQIDGRQAHDGYAWMKALGSPIRIQTSHGQMHRWPAALTTRRRKTIF
ncbi:hypothetical protein [Undibacterium sp. Ji22W]|uniref:hypothetical protein n=1 Tax=Undibacterium sp. Ji22W TaxID=3413038 RepID=UPI003BF00944